MPAREHGVAVLDGRHGAHRIRSPQVILVRLRDAPCADLACLHELGHEAGHFLRLHVGVGAMLVVEIDAIDAQTAQAAVDGATDRLGPRVNG